MGWKDTLLAEYLRRDALAFGRFTLTGGGTSDFYIDGRRVTTSAVGLQAIAEGLIETAGARHILDEHVAIVVPAVSGIAIGVALALRLGRPYVIDRGRAKTHGQGRRFEGLFEPNQRCVVCDDLITAGTTLLHTIQGLRELGHLVSDALVVVDRDEGGREALRATGVEMQCLLRQRDLRKALREHTDGA